jgi:deazaflavin-dependent oxidoreductase (nitroreductase family)
MALSNDMRAFNRQMISDFRAHDPKIAGHRLLLLTTNGVRSGQPHTAPLTYVSDGDRVLVIASNAGAARHPAWYLNLVANPAVTVELHDEIFQARAVVAEGEEYDRLWAQIVAEMPYFTDHQAQISRKIPVVILERIV